MENKRKLKMYEDFDMDRSTHLKELSESNRKHMELNYLVSRQMKESICLMIHWFTIFVIVFFAIMVAWTFDNPKLGLGDFLKDFARFQTEINFDSIKNGVVLSRSIKIPTEILILITIFIWRFSPLAFFKKDSKDKSE